VLLHQLSSGDPAAKDRLWDWLYSAGIAQAGGALSTCKQRRSSTRPTCGWNRAHFFGAAAKAMPRVRVDNARARGSRKRWLVLVNLPIEVGHGGCWHTAAARAWLHHELMR